MSEEAQTTVSEEVTWDNVEEVAPSLEEAQAAEASEANEEASEWDLIDGNTGNEENNSASDESGEDGEEVSVKAESDKDEVESSADKEDGESTDQEEVKEIELSEELKEAGFVSQEGKLGKMVTVDGEEVFADMNELGNDFSGQKALAQRFNEYDQKEKVMQGTIDNFQREMDEVNDYISDLGKTMNGAGTMMEGMAKIAAIAGVPEYKVEEALIRELLPEIERRYGLEENELALEYQRKENEYLMKKSESDNLRLKDEQARGELEGKIAGMREIHGISKEEWQSIERDLLSEVKKEDVTPELVVRYNTFTKAEDRVVGLIKSFNEEYLKNDQLIDVMIKEVIADPQLDDEFYLGVLKDSLKLKEEEEAEALIAKATEGREKEVEAKKPKKKEEKVITDWDEYDED